MIRARESSDRWARRAAAILDRARDGRGLADEIAWALAYLGDLECGAKIPRSLHGSGRATPKAVAA